MDPYLKKALVEWFKWYRALPSKCETLSSRPSSKKKKKVFFLAFLACQSSFCFVVRWKQGNKTKNPKLIH
jgi:hypothetical protein